jgi:hypothetical protein
LSSTPCSFPDCPGTNHSNGLCKAHCGQVDRGQDLHPTYAMRPEYCKYENCDRPLFIKKDQICGMHWHRERAASRPPRTIEPRECRNCGSSFTPSRRRNAECCSQKCAAENSYSKKVYGCTGIEIRRLLESQGSKCLVCFTPLVRGGTGDARAAVDHCHSTGRVRGVLCLRCNIGIGQFRDNPDFLASAIAYLRR